MAQASAREPAVVDPQWVTPVFIAVMLGLVMAFSASYPQACAGNSQRSVDALSFFRSQFQFALAGLVFGWITGLLRPKTIRALGLPGLVACFGLMLAAIIQGSLHGATRGSYNYLNLGFVTFQPSELAKLCFIVYAASLLSRGSLRDKTFVQLLQHPLAIFFVLFCALLIGQHDMGMTILMMAITAALCYLGGMKSKQLVPLLLGVMVLGVGYGMVNKGEHGGRFRAWIDPIATRTDNGYQILAMLVALSRGGMFGQGVGDCPDKWGQMPEAHTDAIFCVMGGELGFLRLSLFVGLTAFIVLRALQIGRSTSDGFEAFLCSGVAIMFGLQALINMAVATNLMPVTGLTLPFISCGGSSLISCLVGAGMVLSVARYRTSSPEAE
jgi:cell division protein FtsW